MSAQALDRQTLLNHIGNLEYRMSQDRRRGIRNPQDAARLTDLRAQLAALATEVQKP